MSLQLALHGHLNAFGRCPLSRICSCLRVCAERTESVWRAAYLPSFQISVPSFQSPPIFSQTTTYFPVTSCGFGPLVLKLKVPISRAAEGPSDLTSRVMSF